MTEPLECAVYFHMPNTPADSDSDLKARLADRCFRKNGKTYVKWEVVNIKQIVNKDTTINLFICKAFEDFKKLFFKDLEVIESAWGDFIHVSALLKIGDHYVNEFTVIQDAGADPGDDNWEARVARMREVEFDILNKLIVAGLVKETK